MPGERDSIRLSTQPFPLCSLRTLSRRMELTLDSTTDLYIPDQGVYKYDTASDTFNTWDKVVAEYNNVETFKGTVEGQTAQEVRIG